jgi:signal transduction histidine kinase
VSRRRARLAGLAAGAIWTVVAWRSAPHPGLHGTPLAIGVTVASFLAAALALVWPGAPFASLPGRRPRAHFPALALLTLSGGTLMLLQPSGPGFAGLVLLVAIASRVLSRRVAALALAACVGFLGVVAVTGEAGWGGLNGGVGLLTLVTIYVAALSSRRIHEQEEKEERLLAELAESRRAAMHAAALAERQRLAREMHDVLAHSLSGLVVQLEGTRLLATAAPGDSRLPAAISRAHLLARGGLEEAREAIGMLRGDALPGPDRLAELAGAFTADTGVPCQFTEAGAARELAPAVRLALYRVTQEALTNVRRHARPEPGRVAVRLEYRPDAVTLAIQDFGPVRAAGPEPAGPGPAGAGTGGSAAGYGLTGMRERAGLLGGTLDASATRDGFRVLLRVPA